MSTLAHFEAEISRYFADAEGERGCTRHAELARYVANELDPAEAAAMGAHLHTCADCATLVDDLEGTAHAWSPAPEPARVIAFPRMLRVFLPALAAGVLTFVFLGRDSGDDDRLTPKGTWSLELAVQRGGKQFLAPTGARLQTGDQLGLFYSSGRDGWLTVLYADDSSAPLRVFPASHDGSAKVSAGQNLPLRDGAVLADGKGCEWVVGLFSKAPLASADAEKLVRQMVADRKGCTLAAPGNSKVDARVVVVNR